VRRTTNHQTTSSEPARGKRHVAKLRVGKSSDFETHLRTTISRLRKKANALKLEVDDLKRQLDTLTEEARRLSVPVPPGSIDERNSVDKSACEHGVVGKLDAWPKPNHCASSSPDLEVCERCDSRSSCETWQGVLAEALDLFTRNPVPDGFPGEEDHP